MSLKDLNKARDKVRDVRDNLSSISNHVVVENPADGDISSDSVHNNTPINKYKQDDKIDQALVRRAQAVALGDPEVALESAFYGINIKAHTAMTPMNQESSGLVFFTRPDLNLTDANCATDRYLANLLTTDDTTFQSAIRAMLDPRGQTERAPSGREPYAKSMLVDPLNPFMPLLTNTCKSLTGWPDPIMDTYVSTPGRRQEVYGIADGNYKIYNQFDLTGTFKNIPYDPVRQMFDVWCMYQSNIVRGKTFPHIKNILARRIDYQTRCWRLILDKSRTYVTRIGAVGAAHPLVTDIGKIFDYESERTLVDSPDVVMQFKCYGAMYNDPLLLKMFNELIFQYNPALREKESREKLYVKLNPNEWSMFNHSAYPLIGEDTDDKNPREMQWWTLKEDYNLINEYYSGVVDKKQDPEEALLTTKGLVTAALRKL